MADFTPEQIAADDAAYQALEAELATEAGDPLADAFAPAERHEPRDPQPTSTEQKPVEAQEDPEIVEAIRRADEWEQQLAERQWQQPDPGPDPHEDPLGYFQHQLKTTRPGAGAIRRSAAAGAFLESGCRKRKCHPAGSARL